MADSTKPDLVIVGAGALGRALALYARRLGGAVVLADRDTPEAGDQPQAALRQAALAASARQAEAQRQGARFGFGHETPKIALKAVQESALQVAASRVALDSVEHLTAQGVQVVRGPVEFADSRTIQLGSMQLRPRRVILAVGAAPSIPDLPGLGEIGFLTIDTIADNTRKLTHLVIIGGGAAAIEQAQIQRRLGAAVTLVPHGGLLPGQDAEAVSLLVRALSEEGIRIMGGASVRTIVPRGMGTGVVTELADGTQEALDASHVLVASGRQPDFDGLRIERLKLRSVAGNAESLLHGPGGRTSSRFVRLAGASAGLEQWHHMLAHGRGVVEAALLGRPRRIGPISPMLVQTEPALAQIGRMPGIGDKTRGGSLILRANLLENDKARARRVEMGLAKVMVDAKGHVLGASFIGPDVEELASVLALAMERGLPLEALADLSVPHPSLFGVLVDLGDRFRAQQPQSWGTQLRRRLRGLWPL